LIGRSPVTSGGVRWCVQWEQIKLFHEIGIEIIANDVIPIALQKKWSEESVKKLNDFISPVTLPRIMVEIAAVTDVGFFL